VHTDLQVANFLQLDADNLAMDAAADWNDVYRKIMERQGM
jgi:hypothetical protein